MYVSLYFPSSFTFTTQLQQDPRMPSISGTDANSFSQKMLDRISKLKEQLEYAKQFHPDQVSILSAQLNEEISALKLFNSEQEAAILKSKLLGKSVSTASISEKDAEESLIRTEKLLIQNIKNSEENKKNLENSTKKLQNIVDEHDNIEKHVFFGSRLQKLIKNKEKLDNLIIFGLFAILIISVFWIIFLRLKINLLFIFFVKIVQFLIKIIKKFFKK